MIKMRACCITKSSKKTDMARKTDWAKPDINNGSRARHVFKSGKRQRSISKKTM